LFNKSKIKETANAILMFKEVPDAIFVYWSAINDAWNYGILMILEDEGVVYVEIPKPAGHI